MSRRALAGALSDVLLGAKPERMAVPIEHAFELASPTSELRAWLEWRRELGDPGPVCIEFKDGSTLASTQASEREELDMSHLLPEESNAAVELAEAMNRALSAFIAGHEPLIRQACQVPADVKSLKHVVVCAFLGHTLEQLRLSSSRAHAEHVVMTVLEQLDRADATERAVGEALQ